MNWMLVVIITTVSYTANVQTMNIPIATEELCKQEAKQFKHGGNMQQSIKTFCVRVKS